MNGEDHLTDARWAVLRERGEAWTLANASQRTECKQAKSAIRRWLRTRFGLA